MSKLRMICLITIPALLSYGGLTYLSSKESEDTISAIIESKSLTPSVETILSSSISSIQKQSKLLVLTVRMNATATTTVKQMGMEGWRMDIAQSDAQYLIDLKQLNSKQISVEGNDIYITLPKNIMTVNQGAITTVESKDNDSWLFTWYPESREKIKQYNDQKIHSNFIKQSQEQKDTAYTQAKVALEDLFKVPLSAAGLQHHVTVTFQ